MLTYHIEGSNAADLRQQIIRDWGAATPITPPVSRPPAPAAPAQAAAAAPTPGGRRKRRTKAEMALAGAPKQVPAPQPAVGNTGSMPAGVTPSPAVAAGTAPATGSEAVAGALSPEQFKAKLQALSQFEGQGLAAVVNLLGEHGVQKVNQVDTKDYAAIAAKADALMVSA